MTRRRKEAEAGESGKQRKSDLVDTDAVIAHAGKVLVVARALPLEDRPLKLPCGTHGKLVRPALVDLKVKRETVKRCRLIEPASSAIQRGRPLDYGQERCN
jgi:hypothetical protein